MNRAATRELLSRALAISRELSQLAEAGDATATVTLNAERRELLRAAHPGYDPRDEDERAVLAEIALLNDRALGLLEHRLRIKGRELDLAAAGRRAVMAYAATG
jgi:hypothetical protein